jgi:hypothetical protein
MSGGVAGYGAGSAQSRVEIDDPFEDTRTEVRRLRKKYNRRVDDHLYLLSEVDEKYPTDGPALITASRNILRDLLEEVRAGEEMLLELEKGEAEEAVAVVAATEAAAAAKAVAAAAAAAAAAALPVVECCLCMQDIPAAARFRIKPCNHDEFCERCVNRLQYQGHTKCPCCRTDIARFEPVVPRGV